MLNALGIIETVGLATAIDVCDKALKVASVTLIGYEYTKGSGIITIKLIGDVSSINVAIEAATTNSIRPGAIYASKIIARPSQDLEKMLKSIEKKQQHISKQEAPIPNLVNEKEINQEDPKLEITKQEEVKPEESKQNSSSDSKPKNKKKK